MQWNGAALEEDFSDMRLVLLGLPGAGKGTQGERLAETLRIPHISTGNIFRQAIQSETELGEKARRYIDRGELVPDAVAIEIVMERLGREDCEFGFILDGFPRTVPQAIALDEALPKLGIRLDKAINIRITEAEAIRRIADRLVCQQCGATYNRHTHRSKAAGVCDVCGGPLVQRPDDTVETARNRLKVYLEQTHPVVDYYGERGILYTVDGEQSIERVFREIMHALGKRVAEPSSGVVQ